MLWLETMILLNRTPMLKLGFKDTAQFIRGCNVYERI